jgi:ABC-type cobalamin/Fe3+-siderophores transport system ATPase subunit
MAIPNFTIQNNRSIRLAKCEKVPQIMVIAGPNGCGKSTLLNELRNQPAPKKPIYVGPHRVSRRQTVQFRYLFNREISLLDVFTKDQLETLEGIILNQQARSPWDYDDAASFVKHGLAQIEVERGEAIKARYDRDGRIAEGLPDVWKPLRSLTDHLLPHLEFHGIDTANKGNVKCLWKVHRTSTTVDLDDLSSGEKSIVQLFYPLVEFRVKKLLDEVRGSTSAATTHDETSDSPETDSVVLIDEPELHLHPTLQVKVFDHLRGLASGGSQVIFTTQSPTLIEYATFEELYLLRPPELVPDGENQLIQLASDDDRLAALRDLFGATSNLTAMQPMVVVEGVHEKEAKGAVSDRKVFRNLDDRFDLVTLVPGRGKSQCLTLRDELERCLAIFSSRLRVVALIDKDTVGQSTDKVHELPVSMIENFLLDPEVFWEAIESVRDKTGLNRLADVESALNAILGELQEYEVERRVLQKIGYRRFQPERPLAEIPQQVAVFSAQLAANFSESVISAQVSEATALVSELEKAKQRREHFDGKKVLKDFFARYLHSSGLSREIFTYYAAKRAAKRASVKAFFDSFFQKVLPRPKGEHQSEQ